MIVSLRYNQNTSNNNNNMRSGKKDNNYKNKSQPNREDFNNKHIDSYNKLRFVRLTLCIANCCFMNYPVYDAATFVTVAVVLRCLSVQTI